VGQGENKNQKLESLYKNVGKQTKPTACLWRGRDMTVDLILTRLDSVKSKGNHSWMACCPAHEDKTPSLAITKVNDGRILMKCFAGCEVTNILAAINLSVTDLFPDRGLGNYRGFQQLERDYQAKAESKKQAQETGDQTYLDICDGARGRGEKLTNQELEKERQIYLRIRHAGA